MMKNLLLAGLLTLVLLILPQPAAAAETVDAGTCGDALTWALTEDGTLTVSGTGAMADYVVFGPWPRDAVRRVVLQDTVTAIGERAFSDCSSLTSVIIPDSVTVIGAEAFDGCRSLRSVNIPDSVTAIGYATFHNCASLTAITLPDSITAIGGWAFWGCSGLSDITIPDSVTTIGERAFMDCTGLTAVQIPASVTAIGRYPFMDCPALTEIHVAEDNPSYASDQGVLFDQTYQTLLCCPAGKVGQYTIPAATRAIGDYAFYCCGGLSAITIGPHVAAIGDCAFLDCGALTCVVLPDTLTAIGSQAFGACHAISAMVFQGNAPTFDPLAFCQGYSEDAILSACRFTAYYPADNRTWTGDVRQGYGGTITWTAYTPFGDVADGAYYEIPVLWAMARDITTGKTETAFGPDDPCTRAQVVTFLWRAAGAPKPRPAACQFTDVKAGAYYYDAVLWAVENGITTGVTDTAFAPEAACTRGQIVTFLHRANDAPMPTGDACDFADVDAAAYYYDPVLWAVEQEITTGISATSFAPNSTCTRGQVVTFLYRADN